MPNNTRPFQFREFLPEVFRAGGVDNSDILGNFLKAFEQVYEELQQEIEGTPDHSSGGIPDLFNPSTTPPPQFAPLALTVLSVSGTKIVVEPFSGGNTGFPAGSFVLTGDGSRSDQLSTAIPANQDGQTQIAVNNAAFAQTLAAGDLLHISPDGGFSFLNYLASWIALPLRTNLVRREAEVLDSDYLKRQTDFNRKFFKTAIGLYPQRGTVAGIEKLLRAWMGDELFPDPSVAILTDLTRTHTDVDTVFQLAPAGDADSQYAQIGFNTQLGEGPPFLFIVDLITNPAIPELRRPRGLDTFQRAARFLLDAEKPAHTYYQLRIRASTMQLAEPGKTDVDGNPAAQIGGTTIGGTTLLWRDPWITLSD
jgi:hypothetical protein